MIQTATHTLLESPASVPELCCSQCSVQVVAAADGERRRLERDIHDGAQQRLVSLALQLGRIGKRLDPESEVGRLLAAARAELAESLQELREIARGLHPAVLVDHGLGAALRALAARAPLPVELRMQLDERRLPAPVELAAYYMVSEALTNVAKHAHATGVTVTAARVGDRLIVEVQDDGAGGAHADGGSGLPGLAVRVAAVGGRLRVRSVLGHGTSVRARIPCGASGAAAARASASQREGAACIFPSIT